MPNRKISTLPAASALTGTELVPLVQGGVTKQTPLSNIIGGTVTSVSVTTANGVSGSVATATTTPAITLTLGAITPTSVAASGAVTGSNLSGTNTGDQTNITGNAATVTTNANLTGPITSTGNATAVAAQTGTGSVFVMQANPTLTTPNIGTASGTSLALSGAISSAAWTTSGLRVKAAAATLTDTSSSGTVAVGYSDLFGATTIAASAATTFTNYYGTYFKDPIAGTNVTMTDKYALGADSQLINGGANQGRLNIQGTNGGYVRVAQAALVANGTVDLGVKNPQAGLFRSNGATAFVYYDTGTGDTVINNVFGGSSAVKINYGGVTAIKVAAVGNVRLGSDDAAAPVAQTIGVQNVVTGTTNTAGVNTTIKGSAGTGTGLGGKVVIQTAPAGSSGSAQNAFVDAVTVLGSGNVGIGTTTPGEKLSLVASDNGATTNILSAYAQNLTAGVTLRYTGLFVAGSSTNIDASVVAKGTGYVWLGQDTSATGIRFSATDSGSNNVWFGNRSFGIKADSGNKIYVGQTSSNTTGLTIDTTNGRVGVGITAPGNALDVAGNIQSNGYQRTAPVAVAALTAAATAGAGSRHFVTDSSVAASGNFGAIVAAGGANIVPVFCDGTNWRIG